MKQFLGPPGPPLPLAFLVAGAMGALLEWLLIRRLYTRPLDTLLVTWGVSLMLQQFARDVFGAPNVQTTAPDLLTGHVSAGGVTLANNRLFILGIALLCVLALTLILRLTPLGRRIRAVVQNRDLAEVSGIATGRVDRTTFFIGSGLAGVAGVALTLVGPIGPTMGTNYIVDAFLVVVVGGIAQLKGSVITAFALGVLQSVLEYSTTVSVAKVVVLVAIVVLLQWRPRACTHRAPGASHDHNDLTRRDDGHGTAGHRAPGAVPGALPRPRRGSSATTRPTSSSSRTSSRPAWRDWPAPCSCPPWGSSPRR